MESTTKTQVKLWQLKTIISEMKYVLDGINNRLDIVGKLDGI